MFSEKPLHEFARKDEREHLVVGPVFIPGDVDTQGEVMSAKAIRCMAFDFVASGRASKIDTNHDLIPNGCMLVQSWVIDEPYLKYPIGTWMAAVKVDNPQIWADIESGKINGFSFYGDKWVTPYLALVKQPIIASGTTEKSEAGPFPAHEHEIEDLRFADDGSIIPTFTKEAHEHQHAVLKGTATLREAEHAHRIEFKRESDGISNQI